MVVFAVAVTIGLAFVLIIILLMYALAGKRKKMQTLDDQIPQIPEPAKGLEVN